MRVRVLSVCFLVGAGLAVPQSPAVAAPRAEAIVKQDIGTLGGDSSWPADATNSGFIAGYSSTADGFTHAFRWRDGVMTDLGALGEASYASVVNERGDVAGTNAYADATVRPFLWRDGVMIDLVSVVGVDTSVSGLNERGEVIGARATDFSGESWRAFRWRNGVATDLPGRGGRTSVADINDLGDIVGFTTAADGTGQEAALWRGGRLIRLRPRNGTEATATAINNRGQVIGTMQVPGSGRHAFLWQAGVFTDLGTLGGTESFPVGINERGQVAGNAETSAVRVPVRWERGTVTDLGTLGGRFGFALGINGSGHVLGMVDYSEDGRHGVVWTRDAFLDLGPLNVPASGGGVQFITDSGRVVGTTAVEYGGVHTAIWETGL
jgi:probable HAF family extracellular repeat protein